MSKLMDKLKEAGDQRKTSEDDPQDTQVPDASADVARFSGNVVVMDRNIWYLSIMCVTFMGFVALVLSFKAFVRIQRGNQNVIQLGRVLIKQDKQMEALNASLAQMRSQSDQSLQSIRDQLAGLDTGKPALEDSRIKEVLKDINAVSSEFNDLKVTHRSMMNKLIELNKEVNVLRKAQYYGEEYKRE